MENNKSFTIPAPSDITESSTIISLPELLSDTTNVKVLTGNDNTPLTLTNEGVYVDGELQVRWSEITQLRGVLELVDEHMKTCKGGE